LILASGSPYRRQMLQSAGLEFDVVPPEVDEPGIRKALATRMPAPTPSEIAKVLARAKAQAVGARRTDALVVGSDQVLALGEELLNKPGNAAMARAQLEQLCGKTHRLLSAVALAQAGEIVWEHVGEAVLTMRRFSPHFLDRYIARVGQRVCQTVGSYEIESLGIQLFERVEGDHFTIIGLPLLPLLAELRSRGVIEA
jgi:septum formation protein